MGSLNRWQGIGNLGRDAEIRYTSGGTPVAQFSLACNEAWTDKGGQRQERTEWVRVVVWGKMAESLEKYLTKGKQVYVEGALQTRQWEDRDGGKRYTTEVNARNIVLLGGGNGGAGRGRGRRSPAEAGPFPDDDMAQPEQAELPADAPAAGELADDDIPF